MEYTVKGIHHITAIARNARRNFEFYTKSLGLRLVKKTVNFDDPETYHLYYGDRIGTPGTILTFFPWESIQQGKSGSQQVTAIGYAVPAGSLEFWKDRFNYLNIKQEEITEKFGESCLPFFDPDGLRLELIVPVQADERLPWETAEINATNATRGFYNATITTNKADATAKVLTEIFGYRLLAREGQVHRYLTDQIATAAVIDLLEVPGQPSGQVAGGSVHHIAFRVENEEALMYYREKVLAAGLHITEKIDRNYFFSLYFREPGGVLFELASDNPGFDVDEPADELGTHLKLPAQYERYRESLEKSLPKLG